MIAFAIVGGFLGKVMAREDTYQHLKIFDDVVSLITSNYVEKVDIDKVMDGAMRGLADSLDPDSAYLSPDEVKQIESGRGAAGGRRRLDLTRQYYLRIIAARDGSPGGKGRTAHRRLRARDQRHADARHVGVGGHAGAARRAGIEGQADHHPRQRRRPSRRRADARGACRRRMSPAGSPRRVSATCASRPSARKPPTR